MKQHHCLILFGAALAGCASMPPQLQPYPGIQRQIVDYYNADNPSEEGFNCNQTEMEGVDRMQVTQESPTQLVVANHYSFQSMDYDAKRRIGCEGFDTRYSRLTRREVA